MKILIKKAELKNRKKIQNINSKISYSRNTVSSHSSGRLVTLHVFSSERRSPVPAERSPRMPGATYLPPEPAVAEIIIQIGNFEK